MTRAHLFMLAVLLTVESCAALASQAAPPLAGRWRYLQPPDSEGEVLDLSFASGRWRGIMNGLERAGEHGLFYYVVEVESLEVAPDGAVRFVVGERQLFHNPPADSAIGRAGDAGVVRDRMRFTGRLEAGDLVLRCIGSNGSCPDSMLRFRRASGAPESRSAAPPDRAGFTVAIRFSVSDTTTLRDYPLGPGLGIRVRREPPLGWNVAVLRGSSRQEGPNLLYHSESWHGPHPSQVYAWSHQSRYFPEERVLPVYGHPYEIRIRLLGCGTSGKGEDAAFVSGAIEVAWRPSRVRHGDSPENR